jgi:hypothetical protein
MKNFLSTLNDAQKGRMYWRLCEGMLNLIDCEGDASVFDASDRKEMFNEFQNMIHALRENWKEI